MEAVGLTPCSQGQEEAEKSWGQRYTFRGRALHFTVRAV